MEPTCPSWPRRAHAAAEAHYGPAAPHLLAAQMTETANEAKSSATAKQELMTDTSSPEVVAEDRRSTPAATPAKSGRPASTSLRCIACRHFGYDDTIQPHHDAGPRQRARFLPEQVRLLYNEVTASNLIKIDAEGNVLKGRPMNTAGL